MVEPVEIFIVFFCIFSFVVLGLRIYARVALEKEWTLELALVIAFCLQIGLAILDFEQLKLLRYQNEINNVATLRKLFFIATFVYFGALWSVKVSINLLHVRITQKFPTVHTWAVGSLYMLALTLLAIYITIFVGCVPFTRKWEASLGKAEPCGQLNRQWEFWFHIVTNIGTDIWLGVLPLPALVHITKPRVRIALFGVYGAAGVTVVVSIVRAVLIGIGIESFTKSIMLLSMIEVATAIVVGSLPCMSSNFTRKYIHRRNGESYALYDDRRTSSLV